jgi:hypothetical protein
MQRHLLYGAAIWWACIGLTAQGDMPADIDAGAPGETAVFGFGWWRAEQNAERTFRWIRFHMEADVWFSLPAQPGGPVELEVLAAPFYHPRRRQRLAMYINGRFVAEWTMAHVNKWIFQPFRAAAPPNVFRAGRNRLTLRAGYIGDHGYAVAVDRIRMAELPAAPTPARNASRP